MTELDDAEQAVQLDFTASHSEARRLLEMGLKLCALHEGSKRPVGQDWNIKPVTAIEGGAGGYGLILRANGLCSVDVDNQIPAEEGLRRCGFSLEEIMQTGVRTSSTRPGSGGRSTYKATDKLERITFSSKHHGTVLELRAKGTNLQDCLPGTVYFGRNETGPFRQDYCNGKTFDQATEPPAPFLTWWERMSGDLDFQREQQALFLGDEGYLAISLGRTLAHTSTCRTEFNSHNQVIPILEAHGYTSKDNKRWAPHTATGAPCVRAIPGKDGLWQSDHASDPLHGTFDAWTANVVLNHGGNLQMAEAAWEADRTAVLASGLPEVLIDPVNAINFNRTKAGEIKATKINVVAALGKPDFCGAELRHDDFRGELMLSIPRSRGWRSFRDTDYTEICLALERQGFLNISKELIRDCVSYTAERQAFDSAKEWLEPLPWDGTPRVEKFLTRYFSASDTPYTRAVSQYLWTAAAGRVLQPGIKADMVPVAVGPQGARKSSAVAAMVPAADFFTSIDLGSRDDDLARLMRGKLFIELGELKGLSSRDADHIKALITRQYEEWIPKYREMTIRYPRRHIFFGTTNRDDFLADETGERRWLPFRCGMCDPDGVRDDLEELWAEARELFLSHGVMHRLAEKLAADEHASFESQDEWKGAVEAWLNRPDFESGRTPFDREWVTIREALTDAINLPDNRQRPQDMHRMKRVLIQIGYTPKNERTSGGGRMRVMVPPSLF